MTVYGNNGLVDIFYIFFEETNFASILVRQAVAVGVGNIHHGSACLNDRLYHFSEVINISPAGIFGIKLNVLDRTFGIFDGVNSTFQDFFPGAIKLMLY